MATSSTATHIRPRRRSRPKLKSSVSSIDPPAKQHVVNYDSKNLEADLSHTTARLDELLGGAFKKSDDSALFVATTKKTSKSEKPRAAKGILKEPKYTNQASTKASETTVIETTDDDAEERTHRSHLARKKPAAIKGNVIERENPQPQELPQEPAANAVEGYEPKSSSASARLPAQEGTSNTDNGGTPLVLSSMADLFNVLNNKDEKSKSVSPQANPAALEEIKAAKVIEADLSFSAMTKEEFEKYRDTEGEKDDDNVEAASTTVQPTEAFRGHSDVFGEDSDSCDGALDDIDEEPTVSIDDVFFDTNDIEESMPPPEPRAFMRLWDALAAWITPAAVYYSEMRLLPETIPAKSDMETTRCAGLMAMINMHLPRCVKEVGLEKEDPRQVRHSLSELLQTFNYCQPNAKLDNRLIRALVCVLLRICFPSSKLPEGANPPRSAAAVGIVMDEYDYLTKSAFASLAKGSG